MLGTSEQTAKVSKTGFTKIGHTAVSKPQWIGFSNKKTGCDKFESLIFFFFHILAWAFSTRTTGMPNFSCPVTFECYHIQSRYNPDIVK